MNRIKLDAKKPQVKKITYGEMEIEVTTPLNLAQIVFLLNNYLKDYFFPEEKMLDMSHHDVLGAEYRLRNYVYQLCTNIDVPTLDNDIFVDDDLWYTVIGEISNFPTFRKLLTSSIDSVKWKMTLDSSLGKVIEDLADKLNAMINSLGEINPEAIEKAGETGKELINQLKGIQDEPVIVKPKRANKKRVK